MKRIAPRAIVRSLFEELLTFRSRPFFSALLIAAGAGLAGGGFGRAAGSAPVAGAGRARGPSSGSAALPRASFRRRSRTRCSINARAAGGRRITIARSG